MENLCNTSQYLITVGPKEEQEMEYIDRRKMNWSWICLESDSGKSVTCFAAQSDVSLGSYGNKSSETVTM
jgi:hypothetical protein